ncbi:hypothetical protein ACSMX9_16640 [Streptomyces sp. LE64]|uniref:hypothetical protein n=1 Tax=unclassified Streptomyces TaxID=2593676 RepID=UPI00343083A3
MTSAPAAYPVGLPRAGATVVVPPATEGRTVQRRAPDPEFSPHLYAGLALSLGAVGGLLVATVRSKTGARGGRAGPGLGADEVGEVSPYGFFRR